MTLDTPTQEIFRFYDEVCALEPTEREVAQVVHRWRKVQRKPRALRRRGFAVVALAVIALSTAFTFPAARDALDRFFSGGAVPGAQADLGSVPAWLEHANALPVAHATPGSERLLAEQDGQRLFAYRDANSGRACLAFGYDSDTCSRTSEWQELFGDHAFLKLASGVGPTADGKVAVFGLARSAVMRVELRDGRAVAASAPVTNGSWVIVADQGSHDSLVALDADGRAIETLNARSWTWTFCTRESGCP